MAQLMDFIIDVSKGKLTTNALVNYCKKTDDIVENYDLKKKKIKEVDLHLHLNQNYEIIKDFIFYNPLQIIFLVSKFFIIFFIMFFLSKELSLIIVLMVPVLIFINMKLGDKISNISEENFSSLKIIKKYISDKFLLTKEERLLDYKQLKNIYKYLDNLKILMNKKYKVEAVFDNFFTYGILNWTICLTTLISGYLVYKNEITIGTVFAYQIYVSSFWGICEDMIGIRKDFLVASPIINQVNDFFDTKLEKRVKGKIHEIVLENYQSLDFNKNKINSEINKKLKKRDYLCCYRR